MSDKIRIGIADLPTDAHTCGCCAGITASGAGAHDNPPGLPAISYRVGTHASFKQAMLARLSAPEFQALQNLRTRDDDDFSIGLIDAWALAADVLSFYQERIVNESYLGTSQEPYSVAALAALIGYRLGSGVAASVDLAFTLENAPGAPEQAVAATSVPASTRVQSIPGPGEATQTFETVEPLDARVAWNSLRPRLTVPFRPRRYDNVLYLAADAVVRPGDALLVVGPERPHHPGDGHWDLRFAAAVQSDAQAGRTVVTLDRLLEQSVPASNPTAAPAIYAMRTRAALFGANAPNPKVFADQVLRHYGPTEIGTDLEWVYSFSGRTVLLDNAYANVVAGGWLVLARPAYRELYTVEAAAETGVSAFSLSARVTQVTVDTGTTLGQFDGSDYRATAAYAGSEALTLADAPLSSPVWGDTITLDRQIEMLPKTRRLIARGRRAVMVADATLSIVSLDDPSVTKQARVGDRLELMAPPVNLAIGNRRWHVRDAGGFEGTIDLSHQPSFVAAAADVPLIAEVVTLDRQENEDDRHARLRLTRALTQVYDLASLEILGNVARATHGESVGEILGSGDPSRAGQRSTLAQTPLTYTRARAGQGSQSTLEVRVGGVRWQEVSYLLGRGPRERVFATQRSSDGKTSVLFGDGVEGARPPAGQNNIHAAYRKGIGLAGLVGVGAASLLTSRPLGVKAVTNPLPAEGAQDPEQIDQARVNAPASVLTLDRVVSLQDVTDFARSFAGVAKALASYVWIGGARRIFVTVAGPGGKPLGDETMDGLLAALHAAGDPSLPIILGPHRQVTFRLRLRVAVDPAYLADDVLAAVGAALSAKFGFDAVGFAQPVALSAIVATAVTVPGMLGVHVVRLARDQPPDDGQDAHPRLRSARAEVLADGVAHGAELLTVEPTPMMEVMP